MALRHLPSRPCNRLYYSLQQLLPGKLARHIKVPACSANSSSSSSTSMQQRQQDTVAPMAAVTQNLQGKVIRGVVFDMDGTLTVPVIDFQYMCQCAGVGPTGDILDVIKTFPPEQQRQALQAIAKVEKQALRDMEAMPGLFDLCSFLDQQGIPRGLITRNVLSSVQFFHENHLPLPPFVPAISRECQFPYKPSPEALLHICGTWNIVPSEVIMIGDSVKDDVVCGNRAGAVTVLLDTEGRYTNAGSALQAECKPAAVVTTLKAFQELLQTTFRLLPPASN